MEKLVYFSEEMMDSIEARDAGHGPCLPGSDIDELVEIIKQRDPEGKRALMASKKKKRRCGHAITEIIGRQNLLLAEFSIVKNAEVNILLII